ncbi:MAG: hypothetical protein IAE67_01505 [Candidatus Competibacteraceae bacterium]|nr:hypothetical protein [Candidatus Competibacteraceae bacterium]
MYKSKPITLLKSFSSSNLRDFEKFLHSPYYNKNELLIQLFGILRKEHPAYEGKNIEREKIYQRLYKDQPFEEPKLRYLFSDFSKLLEQYIMLKELEKNKVQQNQLLLTYYRTHDIEKYFSQVLDETNKWLEQQNQRDSDYYFYRYLTEESLYYYSSVRRDKSLDTILQEAADNLDYYYLSKKLKYLCEMFTRQNFLNSDYHTPLLKEVTEYVRQSQMDSFPAIQAYYYVLQTLIEEDNESHYNQLLTYLDQHRQTFSRDEYRDLYFLAQNYCTKRINKGDTRYLNKFLDLSKILLDKELIYENGYIIPSTFKNIVTVGLRLEEFDWVEEFLIKYKDRLAPKYRDNAYTYNQAWLSFFKGDYRKTLRLLSNVEYMDVYYILDSKILLLKTYYETEDVDAFYSLAESFYVYLRRNDLISDYQKTISLNFVKFVKRLMRIRLGDVKQAELLLSEIKEKQHVASISWLIKKTEQLIR